MPETKKPQKYLNHRQLAEKGIVYSPGHLRRLVKAGKFPAPIKLSLRRHVWAETVIDRLIQQKARA